MTYTEESLEKINKSYTEVGHKRDELLLKLGRLQEHLSSEKARKYALQGVGRRIKLLARCIDNVFHLSPIDSTEHLSPENLADLVINLHAFFVNISGVFDNLAWIFVLERKLLENLKGRHHGVGLFNKETQKHLGSTLKEYLCSPEIDGWHTDYLKNYRDALSHRIPLYVPPAILNDEEFEEYENLTNQIHSLDYKSNDDYSTHDILVKKQDMLGKASPILTHSLIKKSNIVYFHDQIIRDFLTVESIVETFCDSFQEVAE